MALEDELERWSDIQDDADAIVACGERWKTIAAIIGCRLHGFNDGRTASFFTPDGSVIEVGPKFRTILAALTERKAPNAPESVEISGVQCFVFPAGQYAAVDADVAEERKDGARSAGAVARQMATWAGIREAANLKWMLEEMLADANRASFRHGKVVRALKSLLFALHARPFHGYPLLPVEEAIADANRVLDEGRKHD